MTETWMPIPDFDGLYEASILGRIRSVTRTDPIGRIRNGKVLSLCKKGNGYLYFTGTINGRRKNMYVHRAVMSAFCPTADSDKYEVDHIDCNKENNRLDNLEWVTSEENINRASNNGLLVNKDRSLSKDQVIDIYLDDRSQYEIAREYGICQTGISAIKRGKTYKDIARKGPICLGHLARGRHSPNRALTDEQALAIRSDHRPAKQVAEDYGCSTSVVYSIREGRSYKWVA